MLDTRLLCLYLNILVDEIYLFPPSFYADLERITML